MTPPISMLLPGLDGTGHLFEPFMAAAPAEFPLRCLPLPNDRARGYGELADWVCERLPSAPVVLIAESFSGPLALLIADKCRSVLAVVLCASFIEPPMPRVFAWLPKAIWNRPPPAPFVRAALTGGDRELADAVRKALAEVRGDIVAGRIAAVLRADVRAELQRYSRPLLCICAKQDRIVRAGSWATIRALKPSAEFVELEGPHLILQKNPIAAWRHIQPFLERAPGAESVA